MAKCTTAQWIVIVCFIVAGTCTTMLNKYADHQSAIGIKDEMHKFNHPFIQTFFMFVGEFLCGWIYYGIYFYLKWKGEGKEETNKFTKGTRDFNPLLMVPTCIFDLCGTTCCFVGLNLTYASSFQMFRGSVIIFTGIFSVLCLGRRLGISEIVGMLFVVLGLVLVGICDFYLRGSDEEIDKWSVICGDIIIILAQIFLASMMVYQQKMYCTTLDIPVLQAVGFEGFFGLIFICLLLLIFNFCYVGENFGQNPRQVIEDPIDACMQMGNNISIFWALFANIFATTLYNFAGLTITKEISALTRKVLDSVRTVSIWILAILIFGQPFIWQTVLGFIVLLYGLFLYNEMSFFGHTPKKIVSESE